MNPTREMRFTESHPSLVDTGRVFAEALLKNATVHGARAWNETLESLETLTGPRVFGAAAEAVKPGGAVSVLVVTFSLLAATRMILVRKSAGESLAAHADLR